MTGRRAFLQMAAGARDIGGKGKQAIERAQALGWEYSVKYRSCSQGVVAALQEAIDFVPKSEDVVVAACCLDGAATSTGLASCGAFTGGGLVIGSLSGRPGANSSGGAKLARKLVRDLHQQFVKAYGSVVCKEVRAKDQSRCMEVVANAAGWTAEILLGQFTNYKAP